MLFDENDNILLIRRSPTDNRRPSQWDVPGGSADSGEEFVKAAAREVHEEVGIEVAADNFRIVYATSDITGKGNVVWVYFVTRVKNTEPILSDEHDAYQWLSLDDSIDAIEYDRQIKALNYIKQHDLFPPTL